jgi:hypothetical protein
MPPSKETRSDSTSPTESAVGRRELNHATFAKRNWFPGQNSTIAFSANQTVNIPGPLAAELCISGFRIRFLDVSGRDKTPTEISGNSFSVNTFSTESNTAGILSGFRISFQVIPHLLRRPGFSRHDHRD